MNFEEKCAAAEAQWSAPPRRFGCGLFNVAVPMGHEPRYKGKPIPCISQSMPTDMREGTIRTEGGQKVRKHDDGTMSTLDGRPIFDTERNRRKHLERAGYMNVDEG